jgi:hypothetical protein
VNYSTTGTSTSQTTSSGQAAEDTWTGQTWQIAAVSVGLEELHVNGAPPQFWLERRSETNPPVYALKPVQPVQLPECLAPSILLTQRGSVQPGPIRCQKALAAPFVNPHQPYWDACTEVVGDDRDLLRLEGIIQMSDGPHRIRLYQVDNVLAEDKTLLVIDIKAVTSKANPDGTAIGHN